MLLENMTYAEINMLVNDACRQALLLSTEHDDLTPLIKIYDELENGQINLSTIIGATNDQSISVSRLISRLELIRSVLVDMIFCLKKTNEYYTKQCTFKLVKTNSLKKINIGINGMPTEYIDHNITIKLHDFLIEMEKSNSINGLAQFIFNFLISNTSNKKHYTNIDTQLFYADIIYNNFNAIYDEVFKTNQLLEISNEQLPCINLYTWVGGDQDGIPFTTAKHTEAILQAFSDRIKYHYRQDINSILSKSDDAGLRKIVDMLEHTKDPNEITSILDTYDYQRYPDIYLLNLKIKSFGFHYIELEFRENSRVIHEAIDQIIDKEIIRNHLSINKCYLELNEQERDIILTKLISNESLPGYIVNDFFTHHAEYFKQKDHEFEAKSVYEVHKLDYVYLRKYNARRFLEWFSIIKKYPLSANKFGVAEAKSKTDTLAILFCAKAILGKQTLHIVLQPEGPNGAESLYSTITSLYENESYRSYLKKNGDKQYITFGPSDIGKQGGKGMHFSNMQLANMHRIVAQKYEIELITSIVIGYENARCNNIIIENLSEFGVNQGSEIRYMLAGLNEMRHLISTPLMVRNFFKALYDFQFLSSTDDVNSQQVYQNRFNFWIESVRAYENSFFNHSYLPTFLKEVARLDIIKYVTKDHRPQSRKYWLEYAEIDPSQIRAIAWTRSLMLSGLRFEWLGADIWSDHKTELLHHQFEQDVAFNNYIKSIAYACARTNINMTWKTLGCNPPLSYNELIIATQSNTIDGQQFLANIHLRYLKSLKLIYMAIYNKELLEPELFNIDRISHLEFWPDLEEEVRAREKRLDEYYEIMINPAIESAWIDNGETLNHLYSAFINESNMAASYHLTANDKAFPFLRTSN